MRSCNPDFIPCRQVRSDVPYPLGPGPDLITYRHIESVGPNPWDPAAPSWFLVGVFDLVFRTSETPQPGPDISYAWWNCCSLPVRACSPTRIPRRHVRSDVSYPRDPAAALWYLICMFELLFLIREILKPNPAYMETQISMRSALVQFDQSLLGALRFAKDPQFLHVYSENWSECAGVQADLSLRWALMRCCRFVVLGLK